MHGISICSGIGGIDLGLASAIPNYRTVCYVERDAYCASLLATHMQEGTLPVAPIWSDVHTFAGEPWRGRVDVIHGGFPCQPFSLAGRRKGSQDPRHLWPSIARLICEAKPVFTFFENVPGLMSMGLQDVCADLQSMGYDVSAGIFSAAELGAPHIRKRLFIFGAHADYHSKLPSTRRKMVDADPCKKAQRDTGERVSGGLRQQIPDADCGWDDGVQQGRGSGSGGQDKSGARHDGPQESLADASGARCKPGSRGEGGSFRDPARGSQSKRLGRQMADADSQRCGQGRPKSEIHVGRDRLNCGRRLLSPDLADAHGKGPSQRQDLGADAPAQQSAAVRNGGRPTQPGLGRMANGISGWLDPDEGHIARTVTISPPYRIDRLKALGNAVVPAVAAHAWNQLAGSVAMAYRL